MEASGTPRPVVRQRLDLELLGIVSEPLLLGRQVYPRETYAWFRERVSLVHGKSLEAFLPEFGNVDAFSPFGALLLNLHPESVAVLHFAAHNFTDMSLYWQLDNKNVLPEDSLWAECIINANVPEHPGGGVIAHECGRPVIPHRLVARATCTHVELSHPA